jgi:seryl-tRNA synthetase
MHDIKWIRENPEALAAAFEKRGIERSEARRQVDALIAADEARRSHIVQLQEAQERRNWASREIGNAMRANDMARAEELKAEVAEIKGFIQTGEATERELDKALHDALAIVPNIPLEDVPVGKDEHANVELHRFGTPRAHSDWTKEHYEIGEALGLMDFEAAAKLSGARFTVLKGKLARLERALGQFMLDLHTTEHGYTEVNPPLLVRDAAMFGTGQLPKFKEDLFLGASMIGREKQAKDVISKCATKDDVARLANGEAKFEDVVCEIFERADTVEEYWLIPTAEVPLTNLVREEILDEGELPLRFTALTPCFRSEAGSAGKDTRGMLRQHQFYKVEMVSITGADSSRHEHDRMTECAETVLKRLELPFRTVVLSTGDMGFGARKTYDIEVWLPGQNTYREISSCSNCGDFQARRMDARYRPSQGKGTRFVHTLNGSGVAVGRALIAVIENYQNPDGSVTIPQALRPYMGGLEKIEKD